MKGTVESMKKSKASLLVVSLICYLGVFLCSCFAIAGQATWDCPQCGRRGNIKNYCGGCGHPAPVPHMTHAEYMAAANDDEVIIESYVQDHQSWWDNKVTVYLQSEDGAYFAYEMACSEEDAAKLVPGAKIRVKGYKGEWAGEVEIMDGTFEFIEAEPWTAEPTDVTKLLASNELINHMNELVTVKGATVVAQEDGAAIAYKNPVEKTDDLYLAVDVDGKIYNFCVEFYLRGKDSDAYKTVEGLNVGNVVDLEGFLYWYNGPNLQITSVTVIHPMENMTKEELKLYINEQLASFGLEWPTTEEELEVALGLLPDLSGYLTLE